jgi:HEAT repeat protein
MTENLYGAKPIRFLMTNNSQSPDPQEILEKERERRQKENFVILVNQLKHQHMSYRIKAAESLGNTGDWSAVPHLIESMTPDREPEYLYVVMLSVGKLGNTGAVPALIPFLESDEKWVRLGAVKALGMLGDKSAALPLLHVLNDKNWNVRASAAESYSLLGCTEAIEFIVPLLSDDDYRVRESARNALKVLERIEKD